VTPRRVGKHLEGGQLGAGLQRPEALLADGTLVAQLDDVDSARQRGVDELGEVTALTAGVGAQVQLGLGQSASETFLRIRHIRDVSDRSGARVTWTAEHGSPGTGD
jgi:hypothetical protein